MFLSWSASHVATRYCRFFCTIGPKPAPVTDPLVRQAVTRATNVGLRAVHFLNFSGAEMDGCHGHPGWIGHQQVFEQLSNAITEVLGWNGSISGIDHSSRSVDMRPHGWILFFVFCMWSYCR